MSDRKKRDQELTHCPRCGIVRLCNNWTNFGVCDNCYMDDIRKVQRRLAKKYGKGNEDDH